MIGQWLDTQQAVVYAGHQISARTLRAMCRKKRIHFGRNGRRYLFLPQHIDAYFLANGFTGTKRT